MTTLYNFDCDFRGGAITVGDLVVDRAIDFVVFQEEFERYGRVFLAERLVDGTFLPVGLEGLLVPCVGGRERDLSHIRQLRMGSYFAVMRLTLLAYRGASGHRQLAEVRSGSIECKLNRAIA